MRKNIKGNRFQGQINLILGCMWSGKCLGKDTPVLMYNGTIKMVQDIKIDDQIMGDDSTPRNILSVITGKGPLYKITPSFGD